MKQCPPALNKHATRLPFDRLSRSQFQSIRPSIGTEEKNKKDRTSAESATQTERDTHANGGWCGGCSSHGPCVRAGGGDVRVCVWKLDARRESTRRQSRILSRFRNNVWRFVAVAAGGGPSRYRLLSVSSFLPLPAANPQCTAARFASIPIMHDRAGRKFSV